MGPIKFRAEQVRAIPTQIGVYALCDLDEIPIYIGQSTDGIRQRVQRHLTSARSDVIANRQLDVWEVAFVWGWPVDEKDQLPPLESHLFHLFNDQQTLMNGAVLDRINLEFPVPQKVRVQIMQDSEISARLTPERRLPRQAAQFSQLLDHILNVKDSPDLQRSLVAHYERLSANYEKFLGSGQK